MLAHNIGQHKLFLWIQGTRQNVRHFYYLLIKESAGTSHTAALGTAYFVHRFYKHNILLNICLCNGDKGTDIKYIKYLLGHFDIRTTERYLHVSKQQLINIVSPFDDLWNKEQIDW